MFAGARHLVWHRIGTHSTRIAPLVRNRVLIPVSRSLARTSPARGNSAKSRLGNSTTVSWSGTESESRRLESWTIPDAGPARDREYEGPPPRSPLYPLSPSVL